MHLPAILDLHLPNLLPKDGILEYKTPFYAEPRSCALFEILINSIPWQSYSMPMYGKLLPFPRLMAWYGDPEQNYRFSKNNFTPLPWTPQLIEIKNDLEDYTHSKFNGLLLNLYRDQRDHLSWTSDNERELGPAPTIASLSLGATRNFQVKHKTDKGIPLTTLKLESGSLVVMKGEMQNHWLHRIAPSARPCGPRINLTFRQLLRT